MGSDSVLDLLTMRPAFGALLEPLSIDASSKATVVEIVGLAIASVVARRGCEPALAERMQDAFGIGLPKGPLRVQGAGISLLGIAPATWLAIAPSGGQDDVAQLEGKVRGLAAVCDQSGAYGVLRVSGPSAHDLLQAGLFIDLTDNVFGSDAVIVSAIGHMGVVLWRSATVEGFEIAVHRSEAASFTHWLISSAKAAGVSLSRPLPST
jgi:heterotetrameric sarcosine oxidase gamma subunit